MRSNAYLWLQDVRHGGSFMEELLSFAFIKHSFQRLQLIFHLNVVVFLFRSALGRAWLELDGGRD